MKKLSVGIIVFSLQYLEKSRWGSLLCWYEYCMYKLFASTIVGERAAYSKQNGHILTRTHTHSLAQWQQLFWNICWHVHTLSHIRYFKRGLGGKSHQIVSRCCGYLRIFAFSHATDGISQEYFSEHVWCMCENGPCWLFREFTCVNCKHYMYHH